MLLIKMEPKDLEPTLTTKRTKFQKNATTTAKKKFPIVGTVCHQRKIRQEGQHKHMDPAATDPTARDPTTTDPTMMDPY